MPKTEQKSELQTAYDRALLVLKDHTVDSEEYSTVLDRVSELHKMKETEKPSRISRDTLVLAATNILGIVLVIRYENLNVITTKALGLLQRPR